MTHIVQFELLALAGSVGRIVASHHLPPSCDAWFAAEELTQPIPVVDKLLIDNGTRAHNTHVAFDYVDELRKLIQRRLAQDAPHLRDAWIVFDLALRLPLPKLFRAQILLDVVSISDHGAELEEVEVLAVEANATLGVEGRALGLKVDNETQDEAGNEGDYYDRKAEEDVEQALADVAVELAAGARVGDRRNLAKRVEMRPLDIGVRQNHLHVARGRKALRRVDQTCHLILSRIGGRNEDVVDALARKVLRNGLKPAGYGLLPHLALDEVS